MTGGQASERRGLQYAETGPFGTKPASIAAEQGEQFNRAALKRAGIAADRATPDVMDAAQTNFNNRYTSIVRRAGGVPLDPTLEHDVLSTVMDYERLANVRPGEPSAVGSYFREISDAAKNNNGVIPADIFQSISSRIAADLSRMRGNPLQNDAAFAIRDFRNKMFDSIGRNKSQAIVKDYRELNNQYRNYKIIEKAMGGAGEPTAEGFITPSKLRGAVQQGDKGAYAGKGDMPNWRGRVRRRWTAAVWHNPARHHLLDIGCRRRRLYNRTCRVPGWLSLAQAPVLSRC